MRDHRGVVELILWYLSFRQKWAALSSPQEPLMGAVVSANERKLKTPNILSTGAWNNQYPPSSSGYNHSSWGSFSQLNKTFGSSALVSRPFWGKSLAVTGSADMVGTFKSEAPRALSFNQVSWLSDYIGVRSTSLIEMPRASATPLPYSGSAI